MKISVVIPTRHRNDLLARCLDRLAPGSQTLSADDYEVIVTDDGEASTAQQMVAQKYPWARWFPAPRRGPAANRNSGARHATGEFVAFTDDDCVPDSRWLESFAGAIRDDVHVYEGKTTCNAGLRSPLEHSPVNLTGGHLWSCNMMARRSTFWSLGGFDEDFPYPAMEDAAFHSTAHARGLQTIFVASALVDHPPRAVSWKARMMRHESQVIYWKKFPAHRPSLAMHLRRLASSEFSKLCVSPIGWGTIASPLVLAAEMGAIVWNIPRWDREYIAVTPALLTSNG